MYETAFLSGAKVDRRPDPFSRQTSDGPCAGLPDGKFSDQKAIFVHFGRPRDGKFWSTSLKFATYLYCYFGIFWQTGMFMTFLLHFPQFCFLHQKKSGNLGPAFSRKNGQRDFSIFVIAVIISLTGFANSGTPPSAGVSPTRHDVNNCQKFNIYSKPNRRQGCDRSKVNSTKHWH
jgi:hypothetical protein